MKPVFGVAAMRAFDAHAIGAAKVPGIVLMENAGRGAADVALGLLRDAAGRRGSASVVVVAGPGNNGGDGFVMARHLRAAGVAVEVVALAPTDGLRGDARLAADAYIGVGGGVHDATDGEASFARLQGASLVVDALFGTGLARPLSGLAAQAVEAMATCGAPVLALDVPSGLDGDTGVAHGPVVHATATATFGGYKPGLLTAKGAAVAGRITVVGLGVPMDLLPPAAPATWIVEQADVAPAFAPRPPAAHKGTEGHLLIVAGSPGTLGAARLVARGAHRAGAGLVTLAAPPAAADALETTTVETMTARVASPDDLVARLSGKRAVVMGPGMGTDDAARERVRVVLASFEGPVVLDADALTILAREPSLLTGSRVQPILTPHPGEAARLLGGAVADVEADRFGAVRRLARERRATVILKGPTTLVASADGAVFVNGVFLNTASAGAVSSPAVGGAALATGGTGDVLAGVLGALACRLSPRDAACAAVYVHGRAAQRWSERHGTRGLLASELADEVVAAARELGG